MTIADIVILSAAKNLTRPSLTRAGSVMKPALVFSSFHVQYPQPFIFDELLLLRTSPLKSFISAAFRKVSRKALAIREDDREPGIF